MHKRINQDIKHNPLLAHTVHCIGIGGIGVSAIARLFSEQGKHVTGSDAIKSQVTEVLTHLGFSIRIGKGKPHAFKKATELIIYSPAVPESHPERVAARALGIIEMSYPEVIGHLMKNAFGIAIAGTHGKTTTTALLGHIFAHAHYDPTVIVGSMVKDFGGSNERLGKSKYFIVEADEYKASFLNYKPKIILLTNIDLDHLDYYRDLRHIKSVFQEFILRLPTDGVLIANADDPNIASIIKDPLPFQIITYGITKGDIQATQINLEKKVTRFIVAEGTAYDRVEIPLQGVHNILNTLSVYACARHCGIQEELLLQALKTFRGAGRRFDIISSTKKMTIIDDYAHHPTELKAFISAVRQSYPENKIMIVYQPHQEDRFSKLFNYFLTSFSGADKIVLSEIYRVEGRTGPGDSSQRLVRELTKQGENAEYGKSFKELARIIKREKNNYSVIAFVGAGDIIELRKLVQKDLLA